MDVLTSVSEFPQMYSRIFSIAEQGAAGDPPSAGVSVGIGSFMVGWFVEDWRRRVPAHGRYAE